MARAPFIKIFDTQGQYEACCKSWEIAAAIVSVLGDGATIRSGHSKADILWTEGAENVSAGESYDECAAICTQRLEERNAEYERRRLENENRLMRQQGYFDKKTAL